MATTLSSQPPLYLVPVSHLTCSLSRLVYVGFMLRNFIPLAASLTALFSTVYMYTA